MTPFEYAELADDCLELIQETGRPLKLYKLSDAVADVSKPWRGTADAGPVKTDEVNTFGTFVIPNTSIPTQSRGLAFDWIDEELLSRVREVCIVPAKGLPELEDYKKIVDGSKELKIAWGQCLKPGPLRLLYVLGIAP